VKHTRDPERLVSLSRHCGPNDSTRPRSAKMVRPAEAARFAWPCVRFVTVRTSHHPDPDREERRVSSARDVSLYWRDAVVRVHSLRH